MKKVFGLAMMGMFLLSSPCLAADSNYSPKVTAHRAAPAYVPEQTLVGWALAHGMDADYIELDTNLSKDGQLIVTHDLDLATTTDVAKKFLARARADGKFYIVDFTWPEIQTLNVNERVNAKTGQAVYPGRFPVDSSIPLKMERLEDVLKFLQGLNKSTGKNVGVVAEVKSPAFYAKEGKDITKDTIDMLDKFGYNTPDGRCILQSFDYDAMKNARAKGWKGDIAMLVLKSKNRPDEMKTHEWLMTPEGVAEVAKFAKIYSPWFSHLALPKEDGSGVTISSLPAEVRKNGMQLYSWTYRDDAPFKGYQNAKQALDTAFKDIKLDCFITDNPDVVAKYLKENGLRK